MENVSRENILRSSEITSAVVYLRGAQLTRRAQIEVAKGSSRISFGPFSDRVAAQSVVASVGGGARLESVEYAVSALTSPENDEQTAALAARRDALSDSLTALENEKTVCQRLLDMLGANCEKAGGEITVDRLAAVSEYYARQSQALLDRISAIGRESAAKLKQLNAVKAEIAGRDRSGAPSGRIDIVLDAPAAGRVPVELVYTDVSACWTPLYELRVTGADRPVGLQLRGRVSQNTGETWKDVRLTLSSGAARSDMRKPELEPWYIGRPVRPRMKAPVMAAMAAGPAGPAEDLEAPAQPEAEISEGAAAVEYALPQPVTVPDGEERTFPVFTRALTAVFTRVCVPKLDPGVWLTADISGWEKLELADGECGVFLEGSFTGKTRIGASEASGRLSVSLGCDGGIRVKRENGGEYCRSQLIGGARKDTRSYVITAVNTRSSAAVLELHDQIPVSVSGDVKVEAKELSGAEVSDKGELTWKIPLTPGETAQRKVIYTVTSPKTSGIQL